MKNQNILKMLLLLAVNFTISSLTKGQTGYPGVKSGKVELGSTDLASIINAGNSSNIWSLDGMTVYAPSKVFENAIRSNAKNTFTNLGDFITTLTVVDKNSLPLDIKIQNSSIQNGQVVYMDQLSWDQIPSDWRFLSEEIVNWTDESSTYNPLFKVAGGKGACMNSIKSSIQKKVTKTTPPAPEVVNTITLRCNGNTMESFNESSRIRYESTTFKGWKSPSGIFYLRDGETIWRKWDDVSKSLVDICYQAPVVTPPAPVVIVTETMCDGNTVVKGGMSSNGYTLYNGGAYAKKAGVWYKLADDGQFYELCPVVAVNSSKTVPCTNCQPTYLPPPTYVTPCNTCPQPQPTCNNCNQPSCGGCQPACSTCPQQGSRFWNGFMWVMANVSINTNQPTKTVYQPYPVYPQQTWTPNTTQQGGNVWNPNTTQQGGGNWTPNTTGQGGTGTFTPNTTGQTGGNGGIVWGN